MRKIGIGYENYKKIIEDNCYYVDKTFLISDIVKNGGTVTLFTRPRRFGKTLAISMLQTFFEKEYDFDGNLIDKTPYFEGKKIMGVSDGILSMMGQYPVIKLSLKSAKQNDFEAAFYAIREDIASEFNRHRYVLDSDVLSEDIKEKYIKLMTGPTEWFNKSDNYTVKDREDALRREIGKYQTSIKTLSEILRQYHEKNVIILIDEYDVPLENAYYRGFYDEMVGFIRSIFESALKTNDALEFAVVTGCLRISRESIFTGLNNLKINSILNDDFSEGFGFNEEETMEMLKEYGIYDKADEVRKWYDGYLFGKSEIYNPWSVTSYVDGKVNGKRENPIPYWSNTSSNSIIKDLIWNADDSIKSEIDTLISGETIEKQIHEDITYGDIHESEDNLWNFLLFTGYLKKVSERQDGRKIFITMMIPNDEVGSIYEEHISRWFDERVKKADASIFHKAVLEKKTEEMEEFVNNILAESISYYDSDEAFYHGILLTLLYGTPNYAAKSNREEGNGRPDITLYPNRPKDPAFIFEIKIRKKFNEMEDGIEEAFDQIKTKKYEEGILDDGYAGVVSFGVCFCKKSVVFRLKE
ncbi:AAA family ATPase [Butyrivibrio sp. JL13D10]|uniref:AAA family ATPase n=1 Tax=Butyrivibrio sp. JL13D10 TaxID=3236815 RepID=UPI0038B47657